MSRVHLLVGASGGIGRALARQLSLSGAELVLAGRDAATLEPLASELGATAALLSGPPFEALDGAVQHALAAHGRLDGLVNLAGSLLLKPAHRTSQQEWRDTLAANLDTAFAAVRAGAGAMMKSGGSIVLLSSAAVRLGLANHEAIAAAKAGVEGLARAAAASYAARGIRVNAVAPGLIRTGLTAGLLRAPASEAASVAMHALGRLGEPEDVARAIAWLLDPAQAFVTGQVLGVDGGLSSVRPR